MTDSTMKRMLKQIVDLLSSGLRQLLQLQACFQAIPTSGSHEADIPPSSSIPSDSIWWFLEIWVSHLSSATTVHLLILPTRVKNLARSIMKKSRMKLEKEREEMQRKRQQDVLNSAKYYTYSDWTDIMGQVHANQGLTADLLGPDVNEDNFAERMVALIAKRRRDFAAQRFQDKKNKPMTYAQQKAYMRTLVKNQRSTIYTTRWTMKHVKSFSDDQLKTKFDKIRTALAELQSQNIRRSLKRPGAELEQASSKKSKPTEAPKSSVLDESQQPSAKVPPTATQQPSEFSSQPTVPSAEPRTHSYGTRRKSLGAKKKSSTELDLTADDREILHLVDRKDLFKLYGMVVQYYEEHPLAGSGVHVLETISGKILYMFADTPYPLSTQLMKKMLKHKLEVEIEGIGNDMTYAEQLIQFIKNQVAASYPKLDGFHLPYSWNEKWLVQEERPCPRLDADFLVADSKFMKVAFGVGFKMIAVPSSGIVTTSRYVVPTGRVKVPAGRNWLERLPVGSISTWEDLTTRFIAQFFPPGRTTKLRNDILIFQQYQGEYLSEEWTRFKDLLQKKSRGLARSVGRDPMNRLRLAGLLKGSRLYWKLRGSDKYSLRVARVTTFVVACKAYNGEASMLLFMAFFTVGLTGD
ncbi:anticodon-binding aminoacyl-tRNA synthetase, class 1a [Tanacetum coccineum]